MLLLAFPSLFASLEEASLVAPTTEEPIEEYEEFYESPVTLGTSFFYGVVLGFVTWATYILIALQGAGLKSVNDTEIAFPIVSFLFIVGCGALAGLIAGGIHSLLLPKKSYATLSIWIRNGIAGVVLGLILLLIKGSFDDYVQEKNNKAALMAALMSVFAFLGIGEIIRYYLKHGERTLSREVTIKTSALYGTLVGLVYGIFSGITEMVLHVRTKAFMPTWLLYYALIGWVSGVLAALLQGQGLSSDDHPIEYRNLALFMWLALGNLLPLIHDNYPERYENAYFVGMCAALLYIGVVEVLRYYDQRRTTRGEEQEEEQTLTIEERAKDFSIFTLERGITDEEIAAA